MLLLEKRGLEVGLRCSEMESLLADVESRLSGIHSVLILVPTTHNHRSPFTSGTSRSLPK